MTATSAAPGPAGDAAPPAGAPDGAAGDVRAAVEVWMAMFVQLSRVSQYEVHRCVSVDLHGDLRTLAAATRAARLDALAAILTDRAAELDWDNRVRGQVDPDSAKAVARWHGPRTRDLPTVSRDHYDTLRPEAAPTADALVEHFGTWREAQSAAWAHAGPGTGSAWKLALQPYNQKTTRERALAALEAYAQANGELPHDPLAFVLWRRDRITRAHASGKPLPDWPSSTSIAKVRGRGSWPAAVAASGLTAAQINAWRHDVITAGTSPSAAAQTSLSPLTALLETLTDDAITEAGITAGALELIRAGDLGAMTLQDAVRLHALPT